MEPYLSLWQKTMGFKLGAGIGALILTYAGAAWAFVSLANRSATQTWEFVVAALPVVIITIFGVVRLAAAWKLPFRFSASEATESARHGRRVGLLFGVVFAAEFVAITTAAVLLSWAERPLLIPVAVAAIVGAHFLPLAKIFQIPTYGYAGLILLGISLGSLLITNERTRLFTLGISVAVVLWVSAGAVLAIHTGQDRH